MEITEISLLVLAAVPILYRGWNGWRYGASAEMRYLLTIFFGMLVAIRFWQPCTEKLCDAITFDPRIIAITAFGVLFGIGGMVAGYAVNLRAKFFQSVKANYLNNLLGLFSGLLSGSLLAACILWVSSVALPGKFDSPPELQSFRGFPQAVFKSLETAMGVAPDSSGRTKYPVATIADVPVEGGNAPEGAVLMHQRGSIAWK
jgi:uncharacterized membrane protein required for colicin V production